MDNVGLQTLRQEIYDDVDVMLRAFDKATKYFARADEIAYQACGHQLSQMYNAFEQMGLRVAKAFENHIDDEQGWHSGLLKRLTLEIPGMRPALIPHDLTLSLYELKSFRHVFVHAYDLELDPKKLQLVLEYAERVASRITPLLDEFVAEVARQQNLDGGLP